MANKRAEERNPHDFMNSSSIVAACNLAMTTAVSQGSGQAQGSACVCEGYYLGPGLGKT